MGRRDLGLVHRNNHTADQHDLYFFTGKVIPEHPDRETSDESADNEHGDMDRTGLDGASCGISAMPCASRQYSSGYTHQRRQSERQAG